MSFALIVAIAAAVQAATPNPLIGTWIGERDPAIDRMDVARRPVMAITPDAILFAEGRQVTDTKRIRRFDTDGDPGAGGTIAIVTASGLTYRFRLADRDRICRVPDRPHRMPTFGDRGQCWRRASAAHPAHDRGL